MSENGTRRRPRVRSPEAKWEIFLEVTSREITQAEAARRIGWHRCRSTPTTEFSAPTWRIGRLVRRGFAEGACGCPRPKYGHPQAYMTRLERWPQHVMVPSVWSPHEWSLPAVTAAKAPAGASDCPDVLSPQQVIVPSMRSPQVCQTPALTALKIPAGALAWPISSSSQLLLLPQHLTVPAGAQTAHVAATSGDGAVGASGNVGLPEGVVTPAGDAPVRA